LSLLHALEDGFAGGLQVVQLVCRHDDQVAADDLDGDTVVAGKLLLGGCDDAGHQGRVAALVGEDDLILGSRVADPEVPVPEAGHVRGGVTVGRELGVGRAGGCRGAGLDLAGAAGRAVVAAAAGREASRQEGDRSANGQATDDGRVGDAHCCDPIPCV